MESGVNIDSYNIPYGTHPTISSIDIFKNKIDDFRNSDVKKKSGLKKNNYFSPIQ